MNGAASQSVGEKDDFKILVLNGLSGTLCAASHRLVGSGRQAPVPRLRVAQPSRAVGRSFGAAMKSDLRGRDCPQRRRVMKGNRVAGRETELRPERARKHRRIVIAQLVGDVCDRAALQRA